MILHSLSGYTLHVAENPRWLAARYAVDFQKKMFYGVRGYTCLLSHYVSLWYESDSESKVFGRIFFKMLVFFPPESVYRKTHHFIRSKTGCLLVVKNPHLTQKSGKFSLSYINILFHISGLYHRQFCRVCRTRTCAQSCFWFFLEMGFFRYSIGLWNLVLFFFEIPYSLQL